MGFIGPRGAKNRPQYVRKGFVSKPVKGGIVVSGWPAPRGRTTDRYQRSIQTNLQRVTKWASSMNDREVDPLRQALHAFNQSHQGLRGTASIRLEDLLTQLGYGRLWSFLLPNGRTVYSRNAILDISRRLDWLEPQVGSILTRTPTGWLPTVPCTPGAFCMLLPTAPVPGACPTARVSPNTV